MGLSAGDRGVVITESSMWTFDGHGRYRRSPRTLERDVVALDRSLDYDQWHSFELAAFVADPDFGVARLRVLPPGRPAGSFGLLSGLLLWTNLPGGELFARGAFGPPDPWFAPSPVAADAELSAGELPFTAFGQFGPDHLDLRVFDQDTYWVDRNGIPHLISLMDPAYIRNVLTMLTDGAPLYHLGTLRREAMHALGDRRLGRINAVELATGPGIGSSTSAETSAWLESTPLVRALRRTIA